VKSEQKKNEQKRGAGSIYLHFFCNKRRQAVVQRLGEKGPGPFFPIDKVV